MHRNEKADADTNADTNADAEPDRKNQKQYKMLETLAFLQVLM